MRVMSVLFILALPLAAVAATVETIDSVESYVNIRSAPDADADVIGRLQRGIPLPYVDSVEGWHEVEVSEDLTGFVSADWSRVVTDEPPPEPEPEPQAEPQPEPEAEAQAAAPEVPEEPVVTAADVPVEPDAAREQPVVEAEVPVEPEPLREPAAAEPGAIETPEPAVAEDAAAPVVLTGPPGPPGTATIKGDPGFLVRFKEPTSGESSQIFDNGNQVGIGTTEPQQRLEVNGNIQIHEQNSSVAGLMITQATGETGYIMHNRASTLTIGAGSVDRVTVDRDGNVGIGVTRPSHPLQMASGAYVSAGGVWTNSSSRDRKENIVALSVEDALAALAELEPVRYNVRNDAQESHVGFIAEDAPDLVATGDRKGLSAMDIVAVLTRVVQAQQRQIQDLEARLQDQRAED